MGSASSRSTGSRVTVLLTPRRETWAPPPQKHTLNQSASSDPRTNMENSCFSSNGTVISSSFLSFTLEWNALILITQREMERVSAKTECSHTVHRCPYSRHYVYQWYSLGVFKRGTAVQIDNILNICATYRTQDESRPWCAATSPKLLLAYTKAPPIISLT